MSEDNLVPLHHDIPEQLDSNLLLIRKEFLTVWQRLRSGQVGPNEGPFLLGRTTEAAADDFLLEKPDVRAPMEMRHHGQVEGIQLSIVWLYGDPSFCHEKLGPRIASVWSRRLAQPEAGITAQGARSTSRLLEWPCGIEWARPTTAVVPRSGLEDGRTATDQASATDQAPASLARSQADTYRAVEQAIPEDDVDVTGDGCAALEIVWKDESPEEAFIEGVLWRKLPDVPVRTPTNAMVVFCPQQQYYWRTPDERPFLVMTFERADSEGREA